MFQLFHDSRAEGGQDARVHERAQSAMPLEEFLNKQQKTNQM